MSYGNIKQIINAQHGNFVGGMKDGSQVIICVGVIAERKIQIF